MDISLREHCFENAGTRLYAYEAGEGPAIVLIHGGLANHLACWQYAAPLVSRFRVITPDLRAAGKSHYAGPLSWDAIAADIPALLQSLGLSHAIVGGASFGAAAATRVALRHPGAVDALLVLHPAYGGAELGLSPLQQQAMNAMHDAGSRVVEHGIEAMMSLYDGLPPEVCERAKRMAAGFDPASVATTTAFMASGAQPFERGGDLAAIAAPVLLVPGVDPYHPREVADVYRANVRHCEVREGTLAELGGVFLESRLGATLLAG